MKERKAAGKHLSYYDGSQAASTPGVGGGPGGGGLTPGGDRRTSRSRTRERDSVLSSSNQRDSSFDGYFANAAQSPYLQTSVAPSVSGYESSVRSRSETGGSIAGAEDDDETASAKNGGGSTVGGGDLIDPFAGGDMTGSFGDRGSVRDDHEEEYDHDHDDHHDHDEEDEDDDDDDGDVELTLKDRQDVSRHTAVDRLSRFLSC